MKIQLSETQYGRQNQTSSLTGRSHLRYTLCLIFHWTSHESQLTILWTFTKISHTTFEQFFTLSHCRFALTNTLTIAQKLLWIYFCIKTLSIPLTSLTFDDLICFSQINPFHQIVLQERCQRQWNRQPNILKFKITINSSVRYNYWTFSFPYSSGFMVQWICKYLLFKRLCEYYFKFKSLFILLLLLLQLICINKEVYTNLNKQAAVSLSPAHNGKFRFAHC